jgi:hypothetical protein
MDWVRAMSQVLDQVIPIVADACACACLAAERRGLLDVQWVDLREAVKGLKVGAVVLEEVERVLLAAVKVAREAEGRSGEPPNSLVWWCAVAARNAVQRALRDRIDGIKKQFLPDSKMDGVKHWAGEARWAMEHVFREKVKS